MRSLKGLFLLIVTNLLVFLTLVITGNVLIQFVLPAFGIDLRGSFASYQFAWAMVFGFGGAFISLLMSKPMAKSMYRMQQVIQPQTPKEALVFNTVKELAARNGVKMPEVWVYWDDAPNAFATGPGANHSMVAVSSGLVTNLSDDEVRAVLAHEMGHVCNGDMVATTLLQGLMNTFVYFLAGMIARIAASASSRDGEMNYMVYFLVNMVLQVLRSEAVFDELEGATTRLKPVWTGTAEGMPPNDFGARFEGDGVSIHAVIRRGVCSDGMSARPHGFSINAILSGKLGQRMVSGCCSLP